MPLRVLCQHVWYQLVLIPVNVLRQKAEDTVELASGEALTVLHWNQVDWGNATLLHKLWKVRKLRRGTNYWLIQRHGWILNTFCLVKEARPKSHMLCYGDRKEMSYLPEVVKAEIAFKRASQWNFWSCENVLNTVVVDNDSVYLSSHTEYYGK